MGAGGSPDVVVVGAGVVGAACAFFAARAGLRVTVVERGAIAGGTTGAGEGNLLVSDKPPGPELDLALRSLELWRDIKSTVDGFEFEAKGGLVVASSDPARQGLRELAGRQRAAGVEVADVAPDDLATHEPHLAPGLAGGAFYRQDAQVQPMLAAARLLAAAAGGVRVRTGVSLTGVERGRRGEVVAVATSAGRIPTGAVVNAAGPWAADVAGLAGVTLPIAPRRGFILVTEPLAPATIRHKVYAAEYVGDVASDDGALQSSPVVEGTQSGTVLIGATRERVGFDRTLSLPALGRLAAQALALFPVLARVHVIRSYHGFRPYSPDHLPVIGADPRVPGLVHACGHEGAGIGLAPATAELVAGALTGGDGVAGRPFRVDRFAPGGEA